MSVTGFPKNSQDINASASPEVQMNENFRSIDWTFTCGVDPDTTTGSTFGFLGGRWGGTEIDGDTLTLVLEGSPTPSNYIVLNRATKAVSVAQTNTNWNNTHEYARIYRVYTNASGILTVEDHRGGPHGLFGQRTGITWNPETDNYTLALTDGGNGVNMNKSTSVTLTVPPNSSVALWEKGEPVVIRQGGAGTVTVSPGAGVTIRIRESGSPSISNQLAGQYSVAVLFPTETTNEWILTGDIL